MDKPLMCPSCNAFVRYEWEDTCGECGTNWYSDEFRRTPAPEQDPTPQDPNPQASAPPVPEETESKPWFAITPSVPPPLQQAPQPQHWAEQPEQPQQPQQWAPPPAPPSPAWMNGAQPAPQWGPPQVPGFVPQQSHGWRPVHWIILGIAVFLGLVVLVVVGLGFLGYEAQNAGATKPNDLTPPPPAGWTDYKDPSGLFDANMPGQPRIATLDGGLTYTSENGSYRAIVSELPLEKNTTPEGAYKTAAQSSAGKGSLISDVTGKANGGGYEDITIESNGVYVKARWFSSKTHLYGLAVASPDESTMETNFDTLTEGFTITAEG